MRVATSLLPLLLSLSSMPPAARPTPQSSFLPFSLLGSLFGTGPAPPPQQRPRQRLAPRPRPRRPPPQPPRIILRPNIPLGPGPAGPNFSASQPVPLRLNPPTPRPPGAGLTRPSTASRAIPSSATGVGSDPTGPTLTSGPVVTGVVSQHQATTGGHHHQQLDTTTTREDATDIATVLPDSVTERDGSSRDDSFRFSPNPGPAVTEPVATPSPRSPSSSAFLGSERDTGGTSVSGPNVDSSASFSVPLPSDNGRDSYYDELAAPRNPYYAPEVFHYNQDPFIIDDVHQDINNNNIDDHNKESANGGIGFQIYPRGSKGSQRNQPVIISQIPVRSLQTSGHSEAVKKPMPPAVSSSGPPPLHLVLPESPRPTLPSSPASRASPVFPLPSPLPLSQHRPAEPLPQPQFLHSEHLEADSSTDSHVQTPGQPVPFQAEVLPTPQQLQQFDFPKLPEKSGREVQYRPDEVAQFGLDNNNIQYKDEDVQYHDDEARYRASDYIGVGSNGLDESYRGGVVGAVDFTPVSRNLTNVLAQLVDCGAGSDVGFCSMTTTYPGSRIHSLMESCQAVIKSFKAVVPEDLEELGDNSPVVALSEEDLVNERDNSKPWSWKAYAYKKRQICDSELYFIKPGFARDTTGEWQLIVQTEEVQQRVAIDMCHAPGSPCPGVADCGTKSRCVQRYNYQLLLAMDTATAFEPDACPAIRAFKFPTSCICHVETHHKSGGREHVHKFFKKTKK